jgi:hypothetical protein
VPRGSLLARGAREIHAIPSEDVLHKPGAVEACARGFAAVAVASAQVSFSRGQDAGGIGSSGAGRMRWVAVTGPPWPGADAHSAFSNRGDHR